MADPKTHDYTRRVWGHNYSIMSVIDGGQKLRAAGWGHGIKASDFILFKHDDGDTTRYRVDKIDYQSNPRDMWFADLSFAPRTEAAALPHPELSSEKE